MIANSSSYADKRKLFVFLRMLRIDHALFIFYILRIILVSRVAWKRLFPPFVSINRHTCVEIAVETLVRRKIKRIYVSRTCLRLTRTFVRRICKKSLKRILFASESDLKSLLCTRCCSAIDLHCRYRDVYARDSLGYREPVNARCRFSAKIRRSTIPRELRA